VMPLMKASAISDFVITATGDKHILDHSHSR